MFVRLGAQEWLQMAEETVERMDDLKTRLDSLRRGL